MNHPPDFNSEFTWFLRYILGETQLFLCNKLVYICVENCVQNKQESNRKLVHNMGAMNADR